MAASQIFVGTIKSPIVTSSAANTARDGTGSVNTLVTAGSGGARYDRLDIKAQGSSTSGMIRLFMATDATTTTTKRLIKEVLVSNITPSSILAAFQYTERDLGWVLPATHTIYAATHNAEAFTVMLSEGGDF